MFDKFNKLFERTKSGTFNSNNVKKYRKDFEELCNIINLSTESSLTQLFWHIENSKIDIPLCKYCDKNCSWNQHKRTYSNYCSVKCANKDPDILKKRENTNIQKYGGISPTSNKFIKDKQKNTMIERYGVEYTGQSKYLLDKQKNTMIERYGVEYSMHCEKIKNKQKNTMIEMYGEDNPSKIPEFKIAAVETNFRKYGAGCNLKKLKSTIKNKYDVEHFSLFHIAKENLKLLNNPEWLYEQHITNKLSLTEISQKLDVSLAVVWNRFKKFNIRVIRYNISIAQKEINNFISNFFDTIINDRFIINPYELDIVIPSLKIAIEYNGILWHSENFQRKNHNYHLDKTILSERQDYRLIHIFSNEWETKREIVESRLLQLLGKSKRIFARKCMIKTLDYCDVDIFLQENHIQGTVKTSINYGLFFNNELISVMTFNKNRYSFNNAEYELVRFCNKLNHTVVGGASKLFKYFINNINPKNVISYSDRRWNTGNLYKQLGFYFSHNSKPNYFYFKLDGDCNNLYSRIQFQKHKLKDKLEFFNPELTEWENMKNNGYDRIWDCGNSVWLYNS